MLAFRRALLAEPALDRIFSRYAAPSTPPRILLRSARKAALAVAPAHSSLTAAASGRVSPAALAPRRPSRDLGSRPCPSSKNEKSRPPDSSPPSSPSPQCVDPAWRRTAPEHCFCRVAQESSGPRIRRRYLGGKQSHETCATHRNNEGSNRPKDPRSSGFAAQNFQKLVRRPPNRAPARHSAGI